MLVYRFFKVEWTVCAKYTHGGSVKGMVKSNFRFVKKWHISKLQISQIWTKKCETFFLSARSIPKAGGGLLSSSRSLPRQL